MNKVVSIIIPIYNAEKYLKTTMECILNQKYRNLDVVAVNDCSTDTSLQILNEYKPVFYTSGIKYTIVNKKINGGLCAAINDGIAAASGNYFCFPDADDELMPDYISAMMDVLEKNPDKQWVRSDYTIVLEDENREYDVCLPLKSCYKNDYFDFISKFIPHNAWNMIVSKDYFEKCIGKQIYDSRLTQEWSLLLPLSYYSDYARCTEKLYRYHIRKGAMSSWINKDIISVIDHLNALKELNMRVMKDIGLSAEDLAVSCEVLDIYYTLARLKKYSAAGIEEQKKTEWEQLLLLCEKYISREKAEIIGTPDLYVRLVFDIMLNAHEYVPCKQYRECMDKLQGGYAVCMDKPGQKLLRCLTAVFGKPVSVTEYSDELPESDDNVYTACLIENSSKFNQLTEKNSENEHLYIDYRILRDAIRGWNLIGGSDSIEQQME